VLPNSAGGYKPARELAALGVQSSLNRRKKNSALALTPPPITIASGVKMMS